MADKSSVTVLIDNEYRKSDLLNRLGMSVQPTYLCMYQTPTRLFRFDKFGLFSQDKKVSDYLKLRVGLVIVIEPSMLNTNTINRIENVVKNNQNKPILIFIEDLAPRINKLDVSKYFLHIENENVKAFSDYNDGLLWFNSRIGKTNETIICGQVKCKELTSETIDINDMATMFENCNMPLKLWDHYGRLRIVHYSLMKFGYEKTIDPTGWLCKNWKNYKTSIGHGNLWHYTLTRFWVNILYSLQKSNNYKSFDELYKSNPTIHYGSLFKEYYSEDVLFTDYARNTWVKPNLKQ